MALAEMDNIEQQRSNVGEGDTSREFDDVNPGGNPDDGNVIQAAIAMASLSMIDMASRLSLRISRG